MSLPPPPPQTDYFHLFLCVAIIFLYGEDVTEQQLATDQMLLHFSNLSMHMNGELVLRKVQKKKKTKKPRLHLWAAAQASRLVAAGGGNCETLAEALSRRRRCGCCTSDLHPSCGVACPLMFIDAAATGSGLMLTCSWCDCCCCLPRILHAEQTALELRCRQRTTLFNQTLFPWS